ncbi:Bdr family repetitive protein [Borrelia parkeri]|uniref:Bdr family repetitive protein n=1 Tax=Borrelia parkeri TaxID=141 RepID=UPI001FF480C5|nr:Bdr family repetitive protein [Borrelia parkeri]
MELAQPVITQQMVIAELTKAGIKRDIAIDLSYRYYKNELTYKDIEYLETTFNLKLEKVEALLQAEIQKVEATLKSDIRDLDNKFDTKFNELDNKIDTVRSELKSDIKDLDNKIDVNKMELKSTLRLHGWMFGTLITLNIGIFLALMSLLVK